MHFLLADDHTLVREGLRDFLERKYATLKVFEAATFDDTLKALGGKTPFDLVLLDLLMPGMKGHVSVEGICSSASGTPVAILSGTNINKRELEKAFRLGVRGFFPKSMKGESLIHAINHVLSGELYIPPQILSAPDSQGASSTRFNGLLSKRETEALVLLAEGLSNKEIGQKLGVAEPTIKMHVKNLYRKLGVSSRTQAVARFFGIGE